MLNIIMTAVSYFLMILIGFSFKRFGIVEEDAGKSFSKMVLNITLPCAIIISFSSFKLEYSLLILIAFGLIGNTIQILSGYLISRNKSREDKVFYLASCGYNIGNFTLPFTSSLLGPTGVIATSLFDCGNGTMTLGFNYMIADSVSNKGKVSFHPLSIIKKLLSVPAFVTYIVMLLLGFLNFRLPEPILIIAREISKANGPMAMFMIGILMKISFSKRYLKSALSVLGVRFAVATLLSFVLYQLKFLPYEVIKSAILVSWSPIAAVSPAYVARLNGDSALASFTNALSVLLSLMIIPTLAIIL